MIDLITMILSEDSVNSSLRESIPKRLIEMVTVRQNKHHGNSLNLSDHEEFGLSTYSGQIILMHNPG